MESMAARSDRFALPAAPPQTPSYSQRIYGGLASHLPIEQIVSPPTYDAQQHSRSSLEFAVPSLPASKMLPRSTPATATKPSFRARAMSVSTPMATPTSFSTSRSLTSSVVSKKQRSGHQFKPTPATPCKFSRSTQHVSIAHMSPSEFRMAYSTTAAKRRPFGEHAANTRAVSASPLHARLPKQPPLFVMGETKENDDSQYDYECSDDDIYASKSNNQTISKMDEQLKCIKEWRDLPEYVHFVTLEYFKLHPALELDPPDNARHDFDNYLLKNFVQLQRLGAGSFSEVWKVQRKSDGRLFALKMHSKLYLSASDRSTKLEEAQVALTIGIHRNCVHVVDIWEQEGNMHLLMDLCSRGTLAEYLVEKAGEGLSEDVMWAMLADIANGLQHVHALGLMHMDIKPANLFISSQGLIKIGDFGLAGKVDADKSQRGLANAYVEREGDGIYIAPEVVQHIYGSAADIFAFGLIALEIMTNTELPRDGNEYLQLRDGDISAFVDHFPLFTTTPELVTLIQLCLSSDLAKRPSAHELFTMFPSLRYAHEKRMLIDEEVQETMVLPYTAHALGTSGTDRDPHTPKLFTRTWSDNDSNGGVSDKKTVAHTPISETDFRTSLLSPQPAQPLSSRLFTVPVSSPAPPSPSSAPNYINMPQQQQCSSLRHTNRNLFNVKSNTFASRVNKFNAINADALCSSPTQHFPPSHTISTDFRSPSAHFATSSSPAHFAYHRQPSFGAKDVRLELDEDDDDSEAHTRDVSPMESGDELTFMRTDDAMDVGDDEEVIGKDEIESPLSKLTASGLSNSTVNLRSNSKKVDTVSYTYDNDGDLVMGDQRDGFDAAVDHIHSKLATLPSFRHSRNNSITTASAAATVPSTPAIKRNQSRAQPPKFPMSGSHSQVSPSSQLQLYQNSFEQNNLSQIPSLFGPPQSHTHTDDHGSDNDHVLNTPDEKHHSSSTTLSLPGFTTRSTNSRDHKKPTLSVPPLNIIEESQCSNPFARDLADILSSPETPQLPSSTLYGRTRNNSRSSMVTQTPSPSAASCSTYNLTSMATDSPDGQLLQGDICFDPPRKMRSHTSTERLLGNNNGSNGEDVDFMLGNSFTTRDTRNSIPLSFLGQETPTKIPTSSIRAAKELLLASETDKDVAGVNGIRGTTTNTLQRPRHRALSAFLGGSTQKYRNQSNNNVITRNSYNAPSTTVNTPQEDVSDGDEQHSTMSALPGYPTHTRTRTHTPAIFAPFSSTHERHASCPTKPFHFKALRKSSIGTGSTTVTAGVTPTLNGRMQVLSRDKRPSMPTFTSTTE